MLLYFIKIQNKKKKSNFQYTRSYHFGYHEWVVLNSAALHQDPYINVAAVASRWQRVGDLIGSGFESHTSCTRSLNLLIKLTKWWPPNTLMNKAVIFYFIFPPKTLLECPFETSKTTVYSKQGRNYKTYHVETKIV